MISIEVIKGDITKIRVEAIVNAANTSLLGGSGVDGAIHRAGGKSLTQECEKIRDKQGGCKITEAVLTTAGNLPAKCVIHTVGPVWKGGNNEEEKLLSLTYKNCLKLASENGIKSVSFPNISTGRYKFPKEKAAQIAIKSVLEFLEKDSIIEQVFFVCFDEENYKTYVDTLSPNNGQW